MSDVYQQSDRHPIVEGLFLLLVATTLGMLHHSVRGKTPLFVAPSQVSYQNMTFIDIDEVKKKLEEPGVVIVDSRPSKAYEAGRIPSSISIPLHSNISNSQLRELKAARVLIIYCSDEGCDTAKELAVKLEALGLKPAVFAGGFREWVSANYPVDGSVPSR